MNRLVLFSLTAIILSGIGGTALATQVELTLTGLSGVSHDGFAVSPYYVTVDDGSARASVYCDDFIHSMHVGEDWMANVYTLSELSSLRFQGATPSDTLRHYDEAAWLVTQEASNRSSLADIQFAIWGIFDPAIMGRSDLPSGSTSWLISAEGQVFGAHEFSQFTIFTPVDSGSGSAQEVIAPAPEPASLALFGTGMFFLGSFLRKKIKNNGGSHAY